MTIANCTILVAAANRGLGQALVDRRSAPDCVARAASTGMELGEDDIFAGPMSASTADSWRGGAAKAHERQNPFVPAGTSTR